MSVVMCNSYACHCHNLLYIVLQLIHNGYTCFLLCHMIWHCGHYGYLSKVQVNPTHTVAYNIKSFTNVQSVKVQYTKIQIP